MLHVEKDGVTLQAAGAGGGQLRTYIRSKLNSSTVQTKMKVIENITRFVDSDLSASSVERNP